MNTPKTPKPPKRANPKIEDFQGGFFYLGVDDNMARLIGHVATKFTELENTMAAVFQLIIGIENAEAARLTFRAVRAPKARIDLMKTVLEMALIHRTTSNQYDKLIDRFSAINSRRNTYVHSEYKRDNSGQVWITLADGSNLARPRILRHQEVVDFVNEMILFQQDIQAFTLPEFEKLRALQKADHQQA